jgi:hypothetical protein
MGLAEQLSWTEAMELAGLLSNPELREALDRLAQRCARAREAP